MSWSDDQLRTMLEFLPVLAWSADERGQCDYLSPEWLRYTGTEPSEALTSGWLASLHPDDVAILQEALEDTSQSQTPSEVQHRLRAADGSYRWFESRVQAQLDETGKVVRWFGNSTDVHELLESREQLQQAREHLERSGDPPAQTTRTQLLEQNLSLDEFVEHSPAAIALFDADLRCTRVSTQWLSDFGLERNEVLGKALPEIFPHLPREWLTQFEAARQGTVIREQDQRVVGVAPHPEWITWELRPLVRPGQAVHGVAFHSEIVSARKELALALERQTVRLQRSNRDLEQFAYVASHDLQEPLRAVAGCTQLLQARYGTRLDEGGHELIEHAVAGATRMRHLIEDLLAYSRVGSRAANVREHSLSEIVEAALERLKTSVEETGACVTARVSHHVRCDEALLTQVVQNLIGNALKYRSERTPQIDIASTETDEEVVVSVRDNGIGIEPRYFERIFQLFQRLHTRQEYAGTGIGLALCGRIVARHGGRIWVESTPDEGSTFTFTLPKKVPPP